jgi:hypothetical protein
MEISKPIRFREKEEKKDITLKELAQAAHPRFKRMSNYAGRALMRRR